MLYNSGMKKRRHRNLIFNYKDIADVRGVSIYAVRMAVRRGVLEPDNIKSICKYIRRSK